MIFSKVSVIAFAASASVPIHALDVGAAVRRATDYTFDLFSGPNLQDQTSTQSPSELEYTTGGGVPYPQPYEAQRVAETGPLLLQDFHLVVIIHWRTLHVTLKLYRSSLLLTSIENESLNG